MANQEIVEGLRLALSRGSTLQQAMISFHNAGYKKDEIEEAARALYEHPSHPLSHPEKPIPEEVKKPAKKEILKIIPSKIQEKLEEKKETKPISPEEKKQLISKYEEKTKPKGKLVTILLIISLVLFVAIVIGAVLFWEDIANFFGNLF